MDKDTKKEFEKLTKLVKSNTELIKSNSQEIKKLAKTVNEDMPTAEMVNKGFESVATKEDLEELKETLQKDMNEKKGKNVSTMRKIDEKVDKVIETIESKKVITRKEAITLIKESPFPKLYK